MDTPLPGSDGRVKKFSEVWSLFVSLHSAFNFRIHLDKPASPLQGGFVPSPPPAPKQKTPSPPNTGCGHRNAGQELCYLCHQRSKRNIPVSFTEERKKRELEEDRLLQQYQQLKDVEAIFQEQVWMSYIRVRHLILWDALRSLFFEMQKWESIWGKDDKIDKSMLYM